MIFFILYTLCTQAFSTAGSLCCNAEQPTELTAVEMKGENASHYLGKKEKKRDEQQGKDESPSSSEKPQKSAKIAKLGDA